MDEDLGGGGAEVGIGGWVGRECGEGLDGAGGGGEIGEFEGEAGEGGGEIAGQWAAGVARKGLDLHGGGHTKQNTSKDRCLQASDRILFDILRATG